MLILKSILTCKKLGTENICSQSLFMIINYSLRSHSGTSLAGILSKKIPLKFFDCILFLLNLKYKAIFELLLQKAAVNPIYYEIYHVDRIQCH